MPRPISMSEPAMRRTMKRRKPSALTRMRMAWPSRVTTTALMRRIVDETSGSTTVITSACYYFGYISTRKYLSYFGIDSNAVGYTSSDYVLKSVSVLFAPILLLAMLPLVRTAAQEHFTPAHRVMGIGVARDDISVLGVPFVIITVSATLQGFNHNLVRAAASLGGATAKLG